MAWSDTVCRPRGTTDHSSHTATSSGSTCMKTSTDLKHTAEWTNTSPDIRRCVEGFTLFQLKRVFWCNWVHSNVAAGSLCFTTPCACRSLWLAASLTAAEQMTSLIVNSKHVRTVRLLPDTCRTCCMPSADHPQDDFLRRVNMKRAFKVKLDSAGSLTLQGRHSNSNTVADWSDAADPSLTTTAGKGAGVS